LKTISDQLGGTNANWFFGKIVDNDDPLEIGRFKVRIHGLHTDNSITVPNEYLPWAQCVMPASSSGVSGLGDMPRMLPGAQVFGFFLDGEASQIPLILGPILTIESPSEVQQTISATTASNNASASANAPSSSSPLAPNSSSPLGDQTTQSDTEIDENLVGNSNAEKIFNYFVNAGYSPAQSAGLVGNFYAESNLDPKAYNPNDAGMPAEGIAQWRSTRLTDLKQFAQQKGGDYKALNTQLAFTLHELQGKERSANTRLRNATTAKEAAYFVSRYFERPENTLVNGVYTSPSLQKRINYANSTLRSFG